MFYFKVWNVCCFDVDISFLRRILRAKSSSFLHFIIYVFLSGMWMFVLCVIIWQRLCNVSRFFVKNTPDSREASSFRIDLNRKEKIVHIWRKQISHGLHCRPDIFFLFFFYYVYYTNWPWIYAQTIFLRLAWFPHSCMYFLLSLTLCTKTDRLMNFPFYLRAISNPTDD